MIIFFRDGFSYNAFVSDVLHIRSITQENKPFVIHEVMRLGMRGKQAATFFQFLQLSLQQTQGLISNVLTKAYLTNAELYCNIASFVK